jgi:hypothetical protein
VNSKSARKGKLQDLLESGLNALTAADLPELLGKKDYRMWLDCVMTRHTTQPRELADTRISLLNSPRFFMNLLVLSCTCSKINEHLLHHGILGGLDLSRDSSLQNVMLIADDRIELKRGVMISAVFFQETKMMMN